MLKKVQNFLYPVLYKNRLNAFKTSRSLQKDTYSCNGLSYQINSKQHTLAFLSDCYVFIAAFLSMSIGRNINIENTLVHIIVAATIGTILGIIWLRVFLLLFIKKSDKNIIE